MELNQYEKKDLLERAQVHAERAQVARQNFMSAKSMNKMNLWKSIEKEESDKAEQLMKEAGIFVD